MQTGVTGRLWGRLDPLTCVLVYAKPCFVVANNVLRSLNKNLSKKIQQFTALLSQVLIYEKCTEALIT